ncbi:MAG: sodium-dependent transporter [Planctomycetia bacterium]|nr:sodium-dependent transporter [Planctomycetia bacterium]
MHRKKKENWGSQLGVILAVAGSAVGLGNYLRFPGQAALYGGGAFMIPYLFSFLFLAIPLTWSEWALGRYGGKHGYNSVPGIYWFTGKKRFWGYFGTMGIVVPLFINMYYVYLEGWCLVYAIQYFGGTLRTLGLPSYTLFESVSPGLALGSTEQYSQFFAGLVGMQKDGAIFSGSILSPLLIITIFCVLFNFFLIYRGIANGIEKFCKIAMPLLFVCSIIILIRVLTLGNPTGQPGQSYFDGLGFLWNPTRDGKSLFETLNNPEIWLAATSQIFFSVSVGFGLILTYASYVRPKTDIALSGFTATSVNEFCEVVFGGLMIVPPAIMFLGISALTPEKLGSSLSMGFIVLPNVFEQMPAGQIFGFLFFVLLFLAGVTSAISMLQPAIAMLEESFLIKRKWSVLITFLFCATGTSLVVWFSQNAMMLDTFDFWAGNLGLFLIATFQTFMIAWIWGSKNMFKELDEGAKIRVPRFIGFVLKYISAPYLILIFALWAWKSMGSRLQQLGSDPVAQIAFGMFITTILFFLLVTHLAMKYWKKFEDHSKVLEEIPSKKEITK